MKRVIEGKLYNTETAELIHEWSNNMGSRDFKHCEESLYRTTKGAWFLVGEGGPMSKYAEPVSGGMIGGSALTPLSDREAQRWLEDRQAQCRRDYGSLHGRGSVTMSINDLPAGARPIMDFDDPRAVIPGYCVRDDGTVLYYHASGKRWVPCKPKIGTGGFRKVWMRINGKVREIGVAQLVLRVRRSKAIRP